MKEVETLLPLLDEQVELLQQKLSLMRQMGQCVRQNDQGRLEELVRSEALLETAESDLERRTQRIREELAPLAGGGRDPVTLGRLVDLLDGPLSIALNDRRERLLVLVGQLRQEATTTGMLVRQAMELNEELLRALTGRQKPSETYSPDGSVKRAERATTFRESV